MTDQDLDLTWDMLSRPWARAAKVMLWRKYLTS
jgi:hypothetical protein